MINRLVNNLYMYAIIVIKKLFSEMYLHYLTVLHMYKIHLGIK